MRIRIYRVNGSVAVTEHSFYCHSYLNCHGYRSRHSYRSRHGYRLIIIIISLGRFRRFHPIFFCFQKFVILRWLAFLAHVTLYIYVCVCIFF
ncbi:hypothetical protein CLU79DRAFT_765868, partial [Phycomyces nitens]